MNAFEKVLLGFLQIVPSVLPIFVHSNQGILIANASEVTLANVLAQFAAKAPTA